MMTSGVVFLQKVNDKKIAQARELRKSMTIAESLLWEQLRGKKCAGFKIRRQQIIEGFIVDFFCHEAKLVIEVDGSIHNLKDQKEVDIIRKKVFDARGIQEIRFKNSQIINNMSEVLEEITMLLLKNRTSSP